jgi:hypothetical protein
MGISFPIVEKEVSRLKGGRGERDEEKRKEEVVEERRGGGVRFKEKRKFGGRKVRAFLGCRSKLSLQRKIAGLKKTRNPPPPPPRSPLFLLNSSGHSETYTQLGNIVNIVNIGIAALNHINQHIHEHAKVVSAQQWSARGLRIRRATVLVLYNSCSSTLLLAVASHNLSNPADSRTSP